MRKHSAPEKRGKRNEIDLFWRISQVLISGDMLKKVLQLIVDTTAEVMGSKICSLMLLDAEKEELSIAATQALSVDYISKPPLKIGESVSGRAVKEKKPIMVMDVTKDKTYRYPEIAKREGIASMLSVPMLVGHRAIGVINSYTQQPHRFHEEEVKILQAVANQAAVAIENTRLREENLSVKQALEQRKVVERAKYLLMERDRLTEEKAYRILQKMSRDHRKSMGEVASALLLASSLSNKER